MDQFKYHNKDSFKISDKNPEWYPELPFELKLDFELTNLDISIVNGLRRTLLSEIPCVSISPDIVLTDDQNITVFHTEYIKHRLALQPIHLNDPKELDRFGNESKLLFKIADPTDWSKPLVNIGNLNKAVTLADVIVLEKISTAPVTTVKLDSTESKESPAQPTQTELSADAVVAENAKEAGEHAIQEANAMENLLAGEIARSPIPVPELQQSLGEAQLEQSLENALPSVVEEKEQYNRLNPKDFFTYLEIYLVTLKKGESIYAEMRPQIGIGQENARWQPGLISYRFKPRKGDQLTDPSHWNDTDYKAVKDRQDYPKAVGMIAGDYGTPAIFQMSIEYNGHYRPGLVWLETVIKLNEKMHWFLEEVRKITGESGTVTENLSVEFNHEIPNLVTLTVTNESHTLGNIVFSHYLYNLQELVKIVSGKDYKQDILQAFSHYRVPHPLNNKLLIVLRVPNWPLNRLNDGFKKILKPGENPYDDVFYQNSPTMRLLMITLERVVNVLDELETEAKKLLEMTETEGEIPYFPIAKKLPQAPLRESEQKMEILEYSSEITLEEQEIVGLSTEVKEENITAQIEAQIVDQIIEDAEAREGAKTEAELEEDKQEQIEERTELVTEI